MIKVFLTGGLGNQMFQYAAARVLAEKLGKSLQLDLSLLQLHLHSKNTTQRQYELHNFQLNPDIKLTSSKVTGFLMKKIYLNIKKNTLKNWISKHFSIFTNKENFNFDNYFKNIKDNTTLLGNYQTERYFASHENMIRTEFRFKSDLSGENAAIAQKIIHSNAISIHIRRGDYISNSNASKVFCSCSVEYYQNAISYIEKHIENPCFFIFSDEPEAAQKMLSLKNAFFIDWNKGDNNYIDMQLMSLCKHHIIANSSFSWWGAWLNDNPEKIVIAPAHWLKDEKRNKTIKDLIPEKWIKL